MTSTASLERDYEAVAAFLSQGSRFLLTGHLGPDGDTLGSCLALARALIREGKQARVVMRERWSASCAWLPGVEEVVVSETLPSEWPDGVDGLLTLECPDAARTGFPELSLGTVVNIDHHPGNVRYGALNLVDLSAAAAGEVVADLLDLLDWPIDAAIATNLWVALVSDTGSFRFSSTTSKALALGARLVAAGARPGDVNEALYESRPARAVALQGLVLTTLAIHDAGRVATLELPARFLVETGAEAADAEGLSNLARSIDGVRAAALLMEKNGGVSVSMRSKRGVDVRAVAASHGGGGHRNAAGCEIPGPLSTVRERIAHELSLAVQAGSEVAGAGDAA
ncbi:MAG TPA: bifunctional oligoribonuclease/PAP phosphatase NrnA [Thermoanaerobaculia bacterium]|nr:bifunctional oligoribonuclease/PAP phosphatase NrnA [Thermoanaerobaculia bacterium]